MSSISGLNVNPKHATVHLDPFFLNNITSFKILFTTHNGLLSLINRACFINLAFLLLPYTINQGSTAIQCPPTPTPRL